MILEFVCGNLIVQVFDFIFPKNILIKIKDLQHSTQTYSMWESLFSTRFSECWLIHYTAVMSNTHQYLINHGGTLDSLWEVSAEKLGLLLLFRVLAPMTEISHWSFRSFFQSLQENSKIAPLISTRSLSNSLSNQNIIKWYIA